jgi:hypothetical protein
MAIAAKANSGRPGIGVAGETEIAVVAMPRSVTVEIRGMNSLVRATDAIGISVASRAGAGGIIDFVAGGAVFGIGARRTSVIGSPCRGGVGQRHTILTLVTVVAERLPVVAASAIGLLALSVETVSELVVQLVNTAGLVVAPVTGYAETLLLMASAAPIRLERGLFGMLMLPANWMDVGQRGPVSVTDATVPGGADAIVAPHA